MARQRNCGERKERAEDCFLTRMQGRKRKQKTRHLCKERELKRAKKRLGGKGYVLGIKDVREAAETNHIHTHVGNGRRDSAAMHPFKQEGEPHYKNGLEKRTQGVGLAYEEEGGTCCRRGEPVLRLLVGDRRTQRGRKINRLEKKKYRK